MSIKVSAWVWEHSKHRGTQKLLLLALADYANDHGICWPSATALAKRIGETERNTRQLLRQLKESKDILAVVRKGRGNTTRYAIAVGLNEKQRAKLQILLDNSDPKNSVLQNSDLQNTVLENTVLENTDIPRQETVKSGVAVEPASPASASDETPHDTGGIRHVDPSKRSSRAKARKVRSAEPTTETITTEHQTLMQSYQEWLGYPIPNGAQEGAAAKRILRAGYSLDQIDRCYHELKAQAFYANRHLSLQTVYTQVGAITTQKPRAKASTPRLNGIHLHVPSAAVEEMASLSDEALAQRRAEMAAFARANPIEFPARSRKEPVV